MRIVAMGAAGGYWRYWVEWQDNSGDETCFGLEKRLSGGPWQWAGRTPADTTEYIIDVNFSGRLCLRGYAGNWAGRSDYSNVVCVDLPAAPPTVTPPPSATPPPAVCRGEGALSPLGPAPPINLRAEVLADGSTVRLTWDAQSDNYFCYVIERSDAGGNWLLHASFGELRRFETAPTSFDDVLAQPGAYFFCYRMYLGNEAGRSDYSNEACVSLGAPSPTPSMTPTPTPTPSPTPTPTLVPGTCGGEGPVGAPGAPNPPAEFQALLSSAADVCEGFIVRLRWNDDADNELCYGIERKVGEGEWEFYQGGGPVDQGEDSSFSLEDVPQSVGVHCYRVYYANEAGRSAYSDEACVQVDVVPRVETFTPLLSPTPVPTRPPGCNLDGPVGSPQAPTAPSNLRVTLRDEPGLPQPAFVDFTWDDNSTDEACFILSFVGPDLITEVTGPNQTTFSMAAYAQRCGMSGHWCYRVSAANEWGISPHSDEVCLNIEPGAIATPAATAVAAQDAAVGALPAESGATDGGGLGWWWWALTACGAVLMGLAALGLVIVANRRPSSR
jgi:hypothetical protein